MAAAVAAAASDSPAKGPLPKTVASGPLRRVTRRRRWAASSARRVASFPRNLISVSDIIEQYGFVVFDREGAYVISLSPSGDRSCYTRIADRTRDRLFAFDKVCDFYRD